MALLDNIYTAAIIGVGRIGYSLMYDKLREQPASHTAALMQNKRVKIIAACDTNTDNLDSWHKINRAARIYTNIDEFVKNENADIVVIAVNEESHIKVALKIIETHPKLLILEKPVALNMAQGKMLYDAATTNKVPILINHERRNALDYKMARDYIKTIGDILTINARLDTSCYVYNNLKIDTGEYSLLHDGTHLIDIVQYLLEDKIGQDNVLQNMKITSVTYDDKNTSDNKIKNGDHNNIVKNIVRYLNVHYNSKKCTDVNFIFNGAARYFGFEIDIIATAGRVTIGNGIFSFQKRAESTLYSGFWSLCRDKSIKKPHKTRYFSNMVQNAVDFLDGKSSLQSNLTTGLNTLQLIEDIINAL